MCGRFVLVSDLATIEDEFHVEETSAAPARSYNIAPGAFVAAIIREETNRLVRLKWGLVPSWAKDPSMGGRLINARAETLAEKPSFRNAMKKRRCLIVANGFYEWHKRDRRNVPMYIHLASEKPFGFAGLYETWRSHDEKELRTCTIITTTANALLKPIHERMPVIVAKEKESLWLDPHMSDPSHVLPLLGPYERAEMKAYEVSPLVNSPLNDTPDCIAPVSGR